MTDILVIGGGIAGVSAAAECARAGARVTVLESEPQIGYHATGRSAAIFIRNYGNATLRALNALAEPIFEQPAEISESDGMLRLVDVAESKQEGSLARLQAVQ